jgi:hypothetical protein
MPSYILIGNLTRASDNQSVGIGLLADEVLRTIATSVAVGWNFAFTPEADTVQIR